MEESSNLRVNLGIYRLNNLLVRLLWKNIRDAGLNMPVMHAVVIEYLATHPETYQKDLEGAFLVNRSTISKIVQAMEQRGYVRREPVSKDGRLKRLFLTDLGMELRPRVVEAIHITDAQLLDTMTPEQSQSFRDTIQNIRTGLNQKLTAGSAT